MKSVAESSPQIEKAYRSDVSIKNLKYLENMQIKATLAYTLSVFLTNPFPKFKQ